MNKKLIYILRSLADQIESEELECKLEDAATPAMMSLCMSLRLAGLDPRMVVGILEFSKATMLHSWNEFITKVQMEKGE